jgi:hypothetical protein
LATELKKKQQKQQFTTLIGVALLIAVLGVLAAVWIGSTPVVPVEEDAGAVVAPPATASAKPAVVPTAPNTVAAPTTTPGSVGTAPPVDTATTKAGSGAGTAPTGKVPGKLPGPGKTKPAPTTTSTSLFDLGTKLKK